jgi:hypothetical protein
MNLHLKIVMAEDRIPWDTGSAVVEVVDIHPAVADTFADNDIAVAVVRTPVEPSEQVQDTRMELPVVDQKKAAVPVVVVVVVDMLVVVEPSYSLVAAEE